ncbi:hypothetical protein [Frankia sp. Cr1]|uniref:hypothetical protein n=1 Tax=Frankia sp. Cr1 TaxID=3073931 RepID=UPI002AD22543|nr:hypothetical protein [Frankia sp. Cr1]
MTAGGRTPRRRTTSASTDPGPPVINPGGRVGEQDRADALALLAPLLGVGGRPDRLAEARAHDHTAPTYDPNRIVRVLAALRDVLPEQIADWKSGRISRRSAEQMWATFLEGRCEGCARVCEGCAEWADALGYERAVDHGRPVWRSRPTQTSR